MHDKKLVNIDELVTNLENTMTVDYGQQQVLGETVNHVVIDHLGGKNSEAYKVSRPRQHRHLKRKNSILFLVFLDFPHFFIHSGWQDTLF